METNETKNLRNSCPKIQKLAYRIRCGNYENYGNYVTCYLAGVGQCFRMACLVMCRLQLGLKAPALAWLFLALAWRNHEPGLTHWLWLGPAWLWLKPGLFEQKW